MRTIFNKDTNSNGGVDFNHFNLNHLKRTDKVKLETIKLITKWYNMFYFSELFLANIKELLIKSFSFQS